MARASITSPISAATRASPHCSPSTSRSPSSAPGLFTSAFRDDSRKLEQMPGACRLGAQVGAVMRVFLENMRHALEDTDAAGFERRHLLGIVGEQPHL